MKVIKFAPGLIPVLKHQEHDQSTHGSWAEGSQGTTSNLSDDEIRDVIYNSKTVNEMFEKVAKRLGKSMKPSVDNLSEDEITHYRGVPDVSRDAQRLLDGKIKFTEFQTWGQGIYLAEDKGIASNYGTLIGMKLDLSAKIVQGETTWDSAFDVSYDNPSARTRNTTTSNFIDLGRIETQIRAGKMDNLSISDMRNIYWAAKGFDGFTTYGETVLFNGSKLTVNKADIGTAVQKHQEHDQSSHGNWATGGEITNWNPTDAIPDSPKNAGGMTAKSWEAWEHGPDGQNFIALFRKYACQELGLEVPKTPFDQGGYLNYMMDRGWGKPSRDEAKGMLNAIANGRPQPALYRGMYDSDDAQDQASLDALLSTKAGDTFDMPLVSTTRSLGVATWYAADMVGVSKRSIIMKIQEGAKGVALKKENSTYPQDHEVITSGKFEVVSVNTVSTPYWSRSIFEPRKTAGDDQYPDYYEIATYDKTRFSQEQAKVAYEAVTSGNYKSLETPTFKLTQDRSGNGLSSWTKQEGKEFTVIEVKMVEPHTVQKTKDFGNEFFSLFNNMPFIHDGLEDVQKHGSHDQKTHGNWATGGTVYTSIIDRLSQKDVTGFSLDISSRNAPQSGYMTSDAGAEKSVPYDDFFSSRDRSRAILLEYIEKNAQALSDKGAYFGIWVVKDQGTVYLDVSRRYDTRDDAVRAGFANEQQSVYDIENDEYIYMKDEEDDRTNKAVDGGSTNPRQSNDSRAEASLRGGDSQRNREESPHVCLGRYQGVEKHLEGQHDQATHGSWASGRFGADSVKSARDGAKEYAFKAGIKQDDSIDYQKTVANRARAGRIADAYDELPTVQEEAFPAYEALATEVEAQFEYMTKTMGIKVEFVADDPYKTSREMFADASKGVLKVLSTASTGSHPFLSDDQNDKFRAVHDFFGHAATGRGFGQDGEESAWVHHSQMFTETARGALTTETRGQNSWYNTRGKGFAEQKVALLPKEFWEVPATFEKSYKVIRFEPGLIPLLKHQEHDQRTHGSWANGYTAEEIARMDEMSTLGPALEDLEAILNSFGEGPGYDDLRTLVENDHGLYTEAIDGIEERVAVYIENYPNANYDQIFEQEQEKMITEFIDDSEPGSLAGLWMDQNGTQSSEELLTEITPFLEEIFNTDHIVKNTNGESVTRLSSQVKDVYITTDGPTSQGISVKGEIEDADGNFAGEFERIFYQQDGVWVVEHKLLKLQDEYKGLGFGKEFIERSENWYTQRGFGAITVGTGWDGARVWARSGFDWQPESIESDFQHMIAAKISGGQSSYVLDEFQYGQPSRLEFDSLMERATNGYVSGEDGISWDSVKDIKNNDFPLPNDFVMIGYKDRTTSDYEHPITGDTKKTTTWAGHRFMDNLNLNYVKVLTPEGRNLFEGPVDRDGDGLVYDGTAREKPASTVNS